MPIKNYTPIRFGPDLLKNNSCKIKVPSTELKDLSGKNKKIQIDEDEKAKNRNMKRRHTRIKIIN